MEGRETGRGQRVEIWTDHFRLMGNVYIPQIGSVTPRLSDVVNDPGRSFLPLIRVSIYRRGDDQVLAQQEFLLVNRSHIEILRPLD